MPLKISSQFDSGAIEVVNATNAASIELKIRADSHAHDIAQWFHFRLQGARDVECTIRFVNAGKAMYPDGFEGYQVAASYDTENWFRVTTSFDGAVMTVNHMPEFDSVYYAYFEPYSWDRHLRLLGEVADRSYDRAVDVVDIGSTIDGRDMNMVVVSSADMDVTDVDVIKADDKKQKIWIIARQHPGETMAEWFVEGLLDALLDDANPIARKILQKAVFYIVPNMNPDGAVRGNLRTNAAGANLNREWMMPTPERSPEVLCVRTKMHEIGCDMFFDIHGDEALPYNFVAGNESLPGFTAADLAKEEKFAAQYMAASPDFQNAHGYGVGKFEDSKLTIASGYVGHTFKCLALTLEMPFKDNADLPNPETGWNGERSRKLGAALLQPILHSLS